MKPILITTAIVVGMPILLIAGFLTVSFMGLPIPVTSNELHRDWKFKSLVTQGDQIIGGGYVFIDGRDIWIRLRLYRQPNSELFSATEPCSPETLEKIRSWFLTETAASQKILGVIPTSNASQADGVILADTANLRCTSTERHAPITHPLGEYPHGCSSSWILYHEPSSFYYERSPCNH